MRGLRVFFVPPSKAGPFRFVRASLRVGISVRFSVAIRMPRICLRGRFILRAVHHARSSVMEVMYTVLRMGGVMLFSEVYSDAVGQPFYINNTMPTFCEWASVHIKLEGVLIFRAARFAGALTVGYKFLLSSCESCGDSVQLDMGGKFSSCWSHLAKAFGFP